MSEEMQTRTINTASEAH